MGDVVNLHASNGWAPIWTAPRTEDLWILVDMPWNDAGMGLVTWAGGHHFDDGVGRWRDEEWKNIRPDPLWWLPLPPKPPSDGK